METSKVAKEPEEHPAARIFPRLSNTALMELAEDIKKHGLRQPITMHEGKILDGRNRWAACRMVAGVEPEVVEYEGDDPVAFVISQNLRRRHLTQSQLAMVALRVEKLLAAEAKVGRPKKGANVGPVSKRSAVGAAEATGVSPTYVKDAKAIAKASPEVAQEVEEGKLSISKAKRDPRVKGKRRAKSSARVPKLPEALLKVRNKTLHLKNTVAVIEEFVESDVLKDQAAHSVVIDFVRLWRVIAAMHADFVDGKKPIVTRMAAA